MTKRRFPRPAELAPLLKFKVPTLNGKKRRLESALTVWDLRAIAKRRTPKAPFDYCDGGAESELSLARARQAFEDVEFQPAILKNVEKVSTSWDVLGSKVDFPVGIAPTGFTRMMHQDGEDAGATVAAKWGVPFTLSTMGTRSIEHVKKISYSPSELPLARSHPDGRNWFQLYMWKDRDRSMELVQRAAKADFDTLVVTVDVPVAGARLRDKRNGFSIPPALTLGTVLNALPRPWWWFDFLTTDPLEFASLSSWSGTVGELLDHMFDPTVTYDDLKWIKKQWPGKLLVKGVQTVEDAKRLAKAGVDGVVLSNHGGRQLDRAPIPFHLLPNVVKEVGKDIEVHVDTGIMSGADIISCVALGARFTFVGRAYLYGLMAGGSAGVDRMFEIITEQMTRTMRLLGVASLEELRPSHVQQLRRLTHRGTQPV